MFRSILVSALLLCATSTAHAQGDCRWKQVHTLEMGATHLVINGQSERVSGRKARLAFEKKLKACGMTESARIFRQWRATRRTSNASLLAIPLDYGTVAGATAAIATGKRTRLASTLRREAPVGPSPRANQPTAERVAPTQAANADTKTTETVVSEELRVARATAANAALDTLVAVEKITAINKRVAQIAEERPSYDQPSSASWSTHKLRIIASECEEVGRSTVVDEAKAAAERCRINSAQAQNNLSTVQDIHEQAVAAYTAERNRQWAIIDQQDNAKDGRNLVVGGTAAAIVGAISTTLIVQNSMASPNCAQFARQCTPDAALLLPSLALTGVGFGLAGFGHIMVNRSVDGATQLQIGGSF